MINADEKDISNYMRFFCTRMVQAVVQARMGKMHPSPCIQSSDQMIWFNLVMDEIGEVAAYLKSTIGRNYPPECPTFSLEFILLTADGDKLPLEAWIVRFDKECADKFVNIRTTLYQQMSTLLKSIIVASRFTPAYRHYVKNQGPDTFIFCYKVFAGEPDLSLLGEETKYRRLGYLPSPFGTISVELYFRTKMEIQPQPFVPEEISEEKSIGIAIPNAGSKIVSVSPTSLENINLFSTSPISQDLPLHASPKFIVGSGGNSFSSQSVGVIAATSGTKSDPTATIRSNNRGESPPASNNALNTTNLSSNNERNSNISLDNNKTLRKSDVRRNSHIGMEGFVAFTITEESKEETKQVTSNNKIFECSSAKETKTEECVLNNKEINKQNKNEIKNTQEEVEEEENDDLVDDDGCCSSDNSYVKVIAFASLNNSNSDLGNELTEFFKEVKFAPDKLESLNSSENAKELKDQLDTFRQQESSFNQFISDLKEEE